MCAATCVRVTTAVRTANSLLNMSFDISFQFALRIAHTQCKAMLATLIVWVSLHIVTNSEINVELTFQNAREKDPIWPTKSFNTL